MVNLILSNASSLLELNRCTKFTFSCFRDLYTYWFASASLANPYCQSTCHSVCLYVGLSEFLRSNISETKGARGSVTMGSL